MREPERSVGTRLVVESLWTSHEPVAQPGAVASEGDVFEITLQLELIV